MLHLIQLFNYLGQKQKFIDIFSEFEEEVTYLEYEDSPSELFTELLLNHFYLEITDTRQINKITQALLNNPDLSFLNDFKVSHV